MDREEKRNAEKHRSRHARRKRSAGSRKSSERYQEKSTEGVKSAAKKRRKRTAFDVGSTVVLIAAVCVFVFSLYQLVMMLVPYYSGGEEYDKIKNLAITADGDGEGFSVDFDALLLGKSGHSRMDPVRRAVGHQLSCCEERGQ